MLLVFGHSALGNFSGFSKAHNVVYSKSTGTESIFLLTAVQVAAAYLAIAAVLAMAVVTVFVTYLVMTSIVTEHSPFNETNTGRVLRLSQIYLVAAIAMGVLGLLGPHGVLFAAFVFFGCILVSVILYSLALIVRYGSVLQNESDHTL